MEKEIEVVFKIEALNALCLKSGNEALREALHFFMPLDAVIKAVPITKHYRIGGTWARHGKPRNFDIVKKYIHRISLKTMEKLVSRIR